MIRKREKVVWSIVIRKLEWGYIELKESVIKNKVDGISGDIKFDGDIWFN